MCFSLGLPSGRFVVCHSCRWKNVNLMAWQLALGKPREVLQFPSPASVVASKSPSSWTMRKATTICSAGFCIKSPACCANLATCKHGWKIIPFILPKADCFCHFEDDFPRNKDAVIVSEFIIIWFRLRVQGSKSQSNHPTKIGDGSTLQGLKCIMDPTKTIAFFV